MNTREENLKLIASYLSGELSASDREKVKRWITQSTENEKIYNEASRIWSHSGATFRLKGHDSDLLWKQLKSKMDEGETQGRVIPFFARYKTVLQIAASVVILLAVGVYMFPRKAKLADEVKPTPQNPDFVFTTNEQVAMIRLPDSSTVWLGRKSRLTYPSSFGRKSRPVKLQGEAYFEVVRDTTSVFSVATTSATIEVVGTAFNIKEEETAVVVEVTRGEIKFVDNKTLESVSVKATEKAVLKQNSAIVKEEHKRKHVAEWRRSNNSQYEREKAAPREFLKTAYTWHKNALNRSVIKGTITNTATLADYNNIVLRISYVKANGKKVTLTEKVVKTIHAGQDIPYEKRLHDYFSNTRNLKIEIESATFTDQK